MKICVFLLSIFFLLAFAADSRLFAQKREITIILLRHAEKDLSDEITDDPVLSPEGRQRAERLVETLKKYKPEAIYSSHFQRTRYTVMPLAERIHPKYRLRIQLYDHRNLNALVEQMMASGARSIVVAGHNSTTPALANLLIKQNKYKPLAENEYDKIWIIKIKKGKAKDKVIVY